MATGRNRNLQTKLSLTPPQTRLVELMQRINYGRIKDLHVLNGEPLFDPPPRITREIKFGGENSPRPESAKSDFELKQSVKELFLHLEQFGDGVITRIEIQRGLPFRMTIEEVCA